MKNYFASLLLIFLKMFFWCAPFGYLYFFLFLYEPGLGVSGIDPGMTFTSFPSSNGQDLNPRPFDRESSLLPTRPDFRPEASIMLLKFKMMIVLGRVSSSLTVL